MLLRCKIFVPYLFIYIRPSRSYFTFIFIKVPQNCRKDIENWRRETDFTLYVLVFSHFVSYDFRTVESFLIYQMGKCILRLFPLWQLLTTLVSCFKFNHQIKISNILYLMFPVKTRYVSSGCVIREVWSKKKLYLEAKLEEVLRKKLKISDLIKDRTELRMSRKVDLALRSIWHKVIYSAFGLWFW